MHVDIEPTQIGRVFNPDFGIVSDAKAALELFVEVAREWQAAGELKDRSAWAQECEHRKMHMLRRTHYDQVPLKPQRVYQEMNEAFEPRHLLRHHHRPVADRGRAVPARLQAAPLDQLRAGRSARLDAAGGARRARRRSGPARSWRCPATTTSSS